jgi:hypothetical protein
LLLFLLSSAFLFTPLSHPCVKFSYYMRSSKICKHLLKHSKFSENVPAVKASDFFFFGKIV